MATTPAAPDRALITTFGRLVEVFSSLEQRLGASLEERCGIPHSWFEVMLRIARSEDGQVSMGSLAEQIALTTGGVTRLIDRMIAAGYIERVPCPTDRRVNFASLTPAGRAKLQEAAEVHAGNLEQVFADFTGDDLRRLDELLDRLRGRAGTG
ncbi:MarR family winged helix-turn-helix transcriptional regulator [Micromonospora sp. DT47]|uniref:MarR family winged helix-turn-helix transcriptional regulator n=1 Tax=Micromonospora sp. DT47 TaxID=3393431 RepID=UPI003CEDD3D2